jgi:hypothetical protein
MKTGNLIPEERYTWIYICTYMQMCTCSHACLQYIHIHIRLYIFIYIHIYIYMHILYTSSTAQGGGGSFKNRKPIGEVGCCESGMGERSHWWTERCLRSRLFLSLFLYLSLIIYPPTYWSICLPICLSIYHSVCLSIYLCIYLSIYLSICIYIYICFPYLQIYKYIHTPWGSKKLF